MWGMKNAVAKQLKMDPANVRRDLTLRGRRVRLKGRDPAADRADRHRRAYG